MPVLKYGATFTAICSFFIIGNGLFAQDLVKYRPNEAEGYLVLNEGDLNIDQWIVKLHQEVTDENGDKTTTLVNTYTFSDKNYIRFDQTYWSAEFFEPDVRYYVMVEGTPTEGPNVSQGPVYVADFVGYGDGWICTKSCVNSTFAYNLVYTTLSDIIDYVSLEHYAVVDAEGGVSTRVYEYMNTAQKNAILASPYWRWYYNLGGTAESILCNNLYIVQHYYPPAHISNYKDRDGLYITGTVWGIQKSVGIYQDEMFMHDYALGESMWCSTLDMSAATAVMNQQIDFSSYDDPWGTPLTNLECASGSDVVSPGFLDDASGWIGCVSDLIDPQGDIDNFTSYLSSMRECMSAGMADYFDDPLVNNDYVSLWPSNIERLYIIRIDEPSQPFELIYTDMLDENGNFIGKAFSMEKGLYKIYLVGENTFQWPAIVEVKDDLEDQFQQKDLLEVSVFPNPTATNTVSITMTAAADMNVQYKLYDNQNQLKYSNTFSLVKDVPDTKLISPGLGSATLPVGILVHQFIFSDGSVKTLTSLKVNPEGGRN